jgi:hypothetical protein
MVNTDKPKNYIILASLKNSIEAPSIRCLLVHITFRVGGSCKYMLTLIARPVQIGGNN